MRRRSRGPLTTRISPARWRHWRRDILLPSHGQSVKRLQSGCSLSRAALSTPGDRFESLRRRSAGKKKQRQLAIAGPLRGCETGGLSTMPVSPTRVIDRSKSCCLCRSTTVAPLALFAEKLTARTTDTAALQKTQRLRNSIGPSDRGWPILTAHSSVLHEYFPAAQHNSGIFTETKQVPTTCF